jgi:hypothetical protein
MGNRSMLIYANFALCNGLHIVQLRVIVSVGGHQEPNPTWEEHYEYSQESNVGSA